MIPANALYDTANSLRNMRNTVLRHVDARAFDFLLLHLGPLDLASRTQLSKPIARSGSRATLREEQ